MTRIKRNSIICDECGLFCKYYDEYTPFGCSSYDPPEPLEPSHICKKCFPAVKEEWKKNFENGSKYGHWQKSRAEQKAAKECGLVWIHSSGVGMLGTEDFADPYQYIPKEEYERLSKLPYYGYCKMCNSERKNGYCSNKACNESFKHNMSEAKK